MYCHHAAITCMRLDNGSTAALSIKMKRRATIRRCRMARQVSRIHDGELIIVQRLMARDEAIKTEEVVETFCAAQSQSGLDLVSVEESLSDIGTQ